MDLTLAPPSAALVAFADEIGESGPVTVVGGRTHWHVGGEVDRNAREVRAPSGIVAHEPEELIVRCGAGTPVGELDAALAEHGQMCPLDPASPEATVGGVLSVGYSGLRRLRYGPVRDLLLEGRYVAANGELVKAGAPVVKNVTGFDLCRLLVGSIGTLGLLGEVVVRCRPIPQASAWLKSCDADPWTVRRSLFAPSAILWDGTCTWVLLEGHPADLARETRTLGGSFEQVAGPPERPAGGRLSMAPGALATLRLDGPFVAEVGIGTVHVRTSPPAPSGSSAPPGSSGLPGSSGSPGSIAAVRDRINAELKTAFDPTGRLNPGRRP